MKRPVSWPSGYRGAWAEFMAIMGLRGGAIARLCLHWGMLFIGSSPRKPCTVANVGDGWFVATEESDYIQAIGLSGVVRYAKPRLLGIAATTCLESFSVALHCKRFGFSSWLACDSLPCRLMT